LAKAGFESFKFLALRGYSLFPGLMYQHQGHFDLYHYAFEASHIRYRIATE
jgi:hypothetical protein